MPITDTSVGVSPEIFLLLLLLIPHHSSLAEASGIVETQQSIELCSIQSRKTDISIGPWRRLAVLSVRKIRCCSADKSPCGQHRFGISSIDLAGK
jgi:hypothetical protein